MDSLLLARKWAPPLMVLASCTPYRAQYMSNFCDGDIALGELLFLQCCVSVCQYECVVCDNECDLVAVRTGVVAMLIHLPVEVRLVHCV